MLTHYVEESKYNTIITARQPHWQQRDIQHQPLSLSVSVGDICTTCVQHRVDATAYAINRNEIISAGQVRNQFRAGALLMHPDHPLAGAARAIAEAGQRHVPKISAALAAWEARARATRGRTKVTPIP